MPIDSPTDYFYVLLLGNRSGNGGRIRNENEVMVRTRVWRYIDVPKPDFETDWMYISSGNCKNINKFYVILFHFL